MCTGHCFARGYQRFDFSIEDTINITERAYYKGRKADDFSGRERLYLQNKESYGNCTVKVHGGKIFVFDELETCVTMFPVPYWFGRQKNHAKRVTDSFEDIFMDCAFADILYSNQVKSVMALS